MTNIKSATIWTIDSLLDYVYGPEIPEKQYNSYEVPRSCLIKNRKTEILVTRGMGHVGYPVTKTGYTGQIWQYDQFGNMTSHVLAIAYGVTIKDTIASLLSQAADKNILRYAACATNPPMATMEDILEEEYEQAIAKELDGRDPWAGHYYR